MSAKMGEQQKHVPVGLEAHQAALGTVRPLAQAHRQILRHAGRPVRLAQDPRRSQTREHGVVVEPQDMRGIDMRGSCGLHVFDQRIIMGVVAVVRLTYARAQILFPRGALEAVAFGDGELPRQNPCRTPPT